MGRAGMWDLVDLYGDDLQVYAWMQFLCSDPSVPSGKSDKARELFASYCLLAVTVMVEFTGKPGLR